jgi:hypothetical protein
MLPAQEVVAHIKKIKNQKIIPEWEAAEGGYNNTLGGWFRAPSEEDKNS